MQVTAQLELVFLMKYFSTLSNFQRLCFATMET